MSPLLPPVTVDCTCGHQFLSRARRQQSVHCPRCGHSVRVKRAETIAGVQAADDSPRPAPASPAPASPMLAAATALPRARRWPSLAPPGAVVERLAAPATVRPGPVPAGEMTTADALTALGWRISPAAGSCQIIENGRRCRGEIRYPIAGPDGREAWLCPSHNQKLCKVIRSASLRR